MLSSINIYLLIMTIANFFLAFLIYFRSSKTKVALYYSLVVFSAAFWTFCMFMFRNSDGQSLQIWQVILWAVTVPIVYFFLYFSLNFPREQKIKFYWHLLIAFPALAALFIILRLGILEETMFFNGHKGFVFDLPNFYFYSTYIIGYFIIGFAMLFAKYFNCREKYLKTQLFFVIIGSLISALAGVIFGIFLPLAGDFEFYWMSPGLTVALTVFIAYAILKHRLFKIRVVVTELFVGIIALILLSQIFTAANAGWRVLNIIILALFLIFGYYLVNAVQDEGRRRKEAEEMVARERELREEAEVVAADLGRLDQAKTQFLLSTQHHLRSPLSVVQGYLSMISEGDYGRIPIKAKEKIKASLEETQKLIRLVDDLLDVAHFQMNKGMAAKEPTEAVALVSEIVDDLKEIAANKKIYLRFTKPVAPVPFINVDARGIKEAIYNIVDNAVKYTNQGGVLVTMKVSGDFLRISVADTGIGMSEKDINGLFERIFERGKKARNVNIEGRGIGLYLAAQMIKNNDGKIHVQSEGWGKGSTFVIELPMGDCRGRYRWR